MAGFHLILSGPMTVRETDNGVLSDRHMPADRTPFVFVEWRKAWPIWSVPN